MLIISTGSNIGDKLNHITSAKKILSTHFIFVAESSIYTSPAVDYLNQPDFLNQVLQFEIPLINQEDTIKLLLEIEMQMGRVRDVNKGPRTLDLDIIFWGIEEFNSKSLTIPHPAWSQRSFIVLPLAELPFSKTLKQYFDFPSQFQNSAKKLKLNI
jgi:2-amino-4-hydroxy-6-hydroxymethyldihydropteridine diphosphokinase